MATPTKLELQQKIAKLEKGLSNKALSSERKSKLRVQIKGLKDDLAKMSKAKTPSERIAQAKALALKIRKTQGGVPTGKSDVEKDASRGAMKTVRRVSKGLRSNQFGSKSDNKGGVYYEYRENRKDRKPERYPKLADGGMMAKGGDTRPSLEQYKKELQQLRMQKANAITDIDKFRIDKKIREISNIIEHREMADGGMMAKGGETQPYIIWVSKDDDKRQLYGTYKSQRAAEMAMEKLWDNSDYSRMGNKPKSMYEKEGLYADGGLLGYASGGSATSSVGGTTFADGDLSGISDIDLSGGLFANGGTISNQYKGKSAKDVWEMWSNEQKTHFLKDHYLTNIEKYSTKKEYEDAKEQIREVKYSDWDKLPTSIQMEVKSHVSMGQYAHGGETHRAEGGDEMYAKGGETSKYKHKIILETSVGGKFDVALFTSRGDALMCTRSLQEKAPKGYNYHLLSEIK